MRRVVVAIILFVLCISLKFTVEANTVEGKIEEVPASSSEITFIFSFDKVQKYGINLVDPAGNLYNVVEERNEIRINTSGNQEGTFYYDIECEDDDYGYTVSVVEAGKTVASVGESNPVFTENVTNLEIYFVDGSLVAEWNYSDQVSITVTNPNTFENIVNDYQTKENVFRWEMDENIDCIVFYIVPSAYSKVDGAGLIYTRNVVRSIPACVEYPKESIVNKSYITLPIEVKKGTVLIKVYNNNFDSNHTNHNDESIQTIYSEELFEGMYEVQLPIDATENKLTACLIDEQGNAETYQYTYYRDMQAPTIDPDKLSLDSTGTYTGYTTTNNTVYITGVVTDEIAAGMLGQISDFTIDGYKVPLDINGRFSFTQDLILGENTIVLEATDLSGNTTELLLSVIMTDVPVKKNKDAIYQAVLILVLIILVVTYILKKKKRNSVPDSSKIMSNLRQQRSQDDYDDYDDYDEYYDDDYEDDTEEEIVEEVKKKNRFFQ